MNSRRLICLPVGSEPGHQLRSSKQEIESTEIAREAQFALQQFQVAHDRSESVASHPDLRDAPGMSAMPPIATQSVRRNEASWCATSGREQMQQRFSG